MKTTLSAALGLTLAFTASLNAEEAVQPRIAWYGTLKSGLAEAKRTGRPILLVSGAPQCHGVSGIW